MYDVAISFAGEDRLFAEEIAEAARELGLEVFYDSFERAQLWGKDLAVHLDTVYRKNALLCLVLVSESYALKAWTRHEIRSALARAIDDKDEYILPVRLDGTDLPGLAPTIGYLDGRVIGPVEIAHLLAQKLGTPADQTLRQAENLLRLAEGGIPCSTFIIDRRYLTSPDSPGDQFRLAASFGRNVTSPDRGFLDPPHVLGTHVLGYHCITTNGDRLAIWDQWQTARPYSSDLSLASAAAAASSWLAEFDDDHYVTMAGDDSLRYAGPYRSAPVRLSDFRVD